MDLGSTGINMIHTLLDMPFVLVKDVELEYGFANFVERPYMLQARNLFFPDGSLTIYCEVL